MIHPTDNSSTKQFIDIRSLTSRIYTCFVENAEIQE